MSANTVFAFTNATILDGTENMAPQPAMTLVVEGDTIASIAPAAEAQIPEGAQVLDLEGAYLMPGLVNMHVHFCGDGAPVSAEAAAAMSQLSPQEMFAMLQKTIRGSAQQQLASGVTTVRGAGDPAYLDIATRDAINAGEMVGPRIVAPGTGVTVTNGHGAGYFAQIADTPEAAVALVNETVARGADLVKLFITGGVFDATVAGEPGVLRMSPEIARAACEAAHEAGLMVMAHVESTEGVLVALQAGVDTVEHGATMTPEIIELYKGAAGTQLPGRLPSVTCTISPALPFVLLDPEKTASTEIQKINSDVVFIGVAESARQALAEGIPVGLGTDSACPFVTHYDMWREVLYFKRYANTTNAFALHTATQVNAELIGLGDVTGTVEVGKCADLIVCERNPLDDLSALSDVAHVMARGQLVDGLVEVNHQPALDAELEWIMAQPVEEVLAICERDCAGL